MTNPALSIAATKDIGRLYGHPGHLYGKKVNTQIAKEGLGLQELFPSITNIIGVINPELAGYWQFMGRKALMEGKRDYDALKEADKWLKDTGDRGTRVHGFIEDFIDAGFAAPGKYVPGRPDLILEYQDLPSYLECREHQEEMRDLDYIKGFFKFLDDHTPDFIAQETTVYGNTLHGQGYAGTTDFIANIGGKVVIGDWKTTSKLKDTVALQLSAIQKANLIADSNGDLVPMPPTDECWGVQLKPEGTYSVGVVNDTDRAFELFSSAANLWALKTNLEELLSVTASVR